MERTDTRIAPLVVALVALAAAIAVLGAATPAEAGKRVVRMQGVDAPGPDHLDRIWVRRIGPAKAPNVLVLMPGTAGGAGDFTLIGRALVRRTPRLQVWAIDRRTEAFEDTAIFRRALRGRTSAQEAFDYYLGWLTDASIEDHFEPLDPETVPFVRRWGMRVALGDARRVVHAARQQGKRVILGGHSLGASLAVAYASWDFNGRPGYRGLKGLVLIDGGLLGTFSDLDLEGATQAIAELRDGSPFLDLLGLGLPWAAGVFAEVGALYAIEAPGASSPLQDSPLLPPAFRPPVEVTNRALFGYAFDRGTSPEALRLIHVRAGRLAASGTPRDWMPGGITSIFRLKHTFGQEPTNAVEWYFPRRLTIDTDGASSLRRDPVTRFLGLRTWHTREVDVPIYAFQTDLTGGRVLEGARRFLKRSASTRRESMLIDRSGTTSHLDPLTAQPKRNAFLRFAVRFLPRSFRR